MVHRALFLLFLLASFGRAVAGTPCGPDLAGGLGKGTHPASEIVRKISRLDGPARDRLVLEAVQDGNTPAFLRHLRPVVSSGRGHDLVFCVTPDYMALGTDLDFLRIPMGRGSAEQIARETGLVLPTPHMVDLIHAQADLRLSPTPLPPGPQMTGLDYVLRHDQLIDSQISARAGQDPRLVAGHKKDIVISRRLARHRERVAIYGWHRLSGQPTQPLSTVHAAGYADYSHGLRLVSRTAWLDGRPVDISDILEDPGLAGLLSQEGPLRLAILHR